MVRVLTPGTATNASLVDTKENNFLAAVARSAAAAAATAPSGRAANRHAETRIGLAYADLSTGEFRATEFTGDERGGAAARRTRYSCGREKFCCHSPRRFSLKPRQPSGEWLRRPSKRASMIGFSSATMPARQLEEHFRVVALEGFGLSEHPQATAAAGAIVHYLRETSAIGAREPDESAAARHCGRRERDSSIWIASRITSSRTR